MKRLLLLALVLVLIPGFAQAGSIKSGSGTGDPIGASTSCTVGQIPKVSGGVWACAADAGAAGGDDITVESAFADPVDPVFNDSVTIAVTATDTAVDEIAWALIANSINETFLDEDSGTPTDEDVLTYDSTGTNFNWVAQSSLAAGTAAALAANGANCAAGEIPLGVDDAGAVESCYEPATADISDLGAGVGSFLITPSSANLATAVTNETGSGLVVFNDSPVITTPTIASFANAAHDHADAAGGGTLGTASVDTLTDIAAGLKSGADATLITGTATNGECAQFNVDGDIVGAGAACGSGGGLDNVVEDTTPELGGNLDALGYTLDNVGTIVSADADPADAGAVQLGDDEWFCWEAASGGQDFCFGRDGNSNVCIDWDASLSCVAETDTIFTATAVDVPNNATAAQSSILKEDSDNGTDTITTTAPASITSDRTCTLEDDATPYDACVGNTTVDYLTTGTLNGAVDIVITTLATDSPSAAEMLGTFHYSNNDSGTDYTLPNLTTGQNACFYDFNGTVGITIDANAADTFYLAGTALDAGDSIVSTTANAVGDFICILSMNDSVITTLGQSGTWTDGGP